MRLLFAGTPEIAEKVLAGLISYIAPLPALPFPAKGEEAKSPFELIGVLTQPDRPAGRGQKIMQSPVKQLAETHGIPIFQPLSLSAKKDPIAYQALYQTLQDLKPDLMIVTAYGLILPRAILNLPKFGCWNIHVSLLPKWRGAAPIQRAIEAGDSETGICLMQMDAGLDTGDILVRKTCPILPSDTSQILQDKLASLGLDALCETLKKLDLARLSSVENPNARAPLPAEIQDHTQATYAHKIEKAEGKIDWQQSALSIHHKIMAFNPWPVCFVEFPPKGQETPQIIRLWKSAPTSLTHSAAAGSLIQFSKNKLGVVAGDHQILELLELQLPGKKPMTIPNLLNGYGEFFADQILR
jgi:methionyl-tRNA formyltransferase